ncbi:MAG: hypothetical protein PVS2B2_10350 [Candidatus Acidiferrum sp.]
MPLRFWFRLAEFCAAAILVVSLLYAWRAEYRDRSILVADLAKTHQALVQATARQDDRDQRLAKMLASFEERKRAVQTPAQIVRQLPSELPLPVPLTLAPPEMPDGSFASVKEKSSLPDSVLSRVRVQVPAADLKPLYDFAVDCHACQDRLAAATSDLADERAKTATLGRERDNALRLARGGSVLRRVARASKWFIIGAAAGAFAAKIVR